MNRLDKCIKLNFGMVENEIGIMCVMAMGIILCGLGLTLLILVPVLAVVQVVFVVKMYKKLYYTSLYGETAVLYQSIPVSVEEMAVSRIFTAGTALLMANIVTVLCFVITMNMGTLAGSIFNLMLDIADIDWGDYSLESLLPLTFLASVSSIYRQSAYILAVVVIYNSLPEVRRKEGAKLITFLIAGAIHVALGSMDKLLKLLGAEQTDLWVPAVCILFDIVLTVVFYRITVKLLKEKYALN